MNARSYACEEFYRIRIIIYSAEGIQDEPLGIYSRRATKNSCREEAEGRPRELCRDAITLYFLDGCGDGVTFAKHCRSTTPVTTSYGVHVARAGSSWRARKLFTS